MDGAEIHGIKAISGVDDIEGCDYTLFRVRFVKRINAEEVPGTALDQDG
jgi:hypothetical protein